MQTFGILSLVFLQDKLYSEQWRKVATEVQDKKVTKNRQTSTLIWYKPASRARVGQ